MSKFAGLPISIEFLGLFDTVAAVGFADSVPFAAGHMSWADGTMRLPDEERTFSAKLDLLRASSLSDNPLRPAGASPNVRPDIFREK